MNYKQFSNLSCYEEFEIQCDLTGISKLDVLKEIGHQINNYYLFIPNDGIFNWYDLEGNHIENPCMLKELKIQHIPQNITKCIIPDSVTSIGNGVFYNCKLLKEIIIPDSVKCIGNAAFSHCKSLQSITIPNSVTSIGNSTFSFCKSLKEITIPNSVTSIGDNVFSWCESLQSITIPNSVTSIGDSAFYSCDSLKEITIPNNVTSIGDWAFSNCKSLKEVNFKGKTLEEVKQMAGYPFGIEFI